MAQVDYCSLQCEVKGLVQVRCLLMFGLLVRGKPGNSELVI
jgi:hypothetical protein